MNHVSFERQACGHSPLITAKDMIKRYGGETTVDAVRAKARCSLRRQRIFECRIVYRGASFDTLLGAENTTMKSEV